jgi:FAD/FMN-containing dehydrogenase
MGFYLQALSLEAFTEASDVLAAALLLIVHLNGINSLAGLKPVNFRSRIDHDDEDGELTQAYLCDAARGVLTRRSISSSTLVAPSEEEEEEEIKQAVRNAAKVKVFGAGHSFNEGNVSDQLLISLDNYSGLVSKDLADNQITVRGGTRVRDVVKLLAEDGLALAALPSHDAQSIAGILSTDVHGTGRVGDSSAARSCVSSCSTGTA